MSKIKDNLVMYQRISILMIADILFVFLASILSIAVRLDFSNLDYEFLTSYFEWCWLDAIIVLVAFWMLDMYKSMWKFASLVELRRLISAVVLTAFVKLFVFNLIIHLHVPRSWYLLDPMFLLAFCASTRFMYRNLRSLRSQLSNANKKIENVINVMIIGAGEAGNILLRETLISEQMKRKVVCMIDDNHLLKGSLMNGVRIVGNRNDIIDSVKKYHVEEIYIAMPSARLKQEVKS